MSRLQSLGVCLLLFSCLPSTAVDAVSVAVGTGDHYLSSYRFAIKWQWDKRWFEHDNYYVTGNWVLDTSYLVQDKSASLFDQGPKELLATGFSPVLRLQFTDNIWRLQPYLEIGVGVAYLSHKSIRTGERRSLQLGSNFQFEDRVSAGIIFGGENPWEMALQAIHYSNADLASENKGVNAYVLMLSKHL